MSISSICRDLRKNRTDPDITYKLRRIWELLVMYDEGGEASLLGDMTTGEVIIHWNIFALLFLFFRFITR